jgi:hypothetical protein
MAKTDKRMPKLRVVVRNWWGQWELGSSKVKVKAVFRRLFGTDFVQSIVPSPLETSFLYHSRRCVSARHTAHSASEGRN